MIAAIYARKRPEQGTPRGEESAMSVSVKRIKTHSTGVRQARVGLRGGPTR